MTSVLAGAAKGKREHNQLLRESNANFCVNTIYRCLKRNTHFLEGRIRIILDQNQVSQSPWTAEEAGVIVLKACNKFYGDPMQLEKHPLKLKPFEVKYYNASPHELNIAPLGLSVERVVPGGLVAIPQSYAVGGNKSAVAGVAPQLRPCPQIEQDYLLDLSPTTFAEWVTYTDFKVSKCCGSHILWSDTKQCLHCFNCMNEVAL